MLAPIEKIVHRRVRDQVAVGDLEGHTYALDRVSCLVDNGETAFTQLSLDDVLSQFLFCLQHGSWSFVTENYPAGWRLL